MCPNGKDVKFDADYYKNKHFPMVSKVVGNPLKGLELDLGLEAEFLEN